MSVFKERQMKNYMAEYDHVLFDLDGTLSRSARGIRKSLEKTIRDMNKPVPDLSDYTKYIGPPLLNTFKNLCGFTDEESQKALEIYKHYYSTEGIYENHLYDGMEQVLSALKKAGVKLAVCSSKYELFTQKVCSLLQIDSLFDAVCGSAKDGSRKEKEELIPYAVAHLGGSMHDRVAMVGDTHFDAAGARIAGVDFIGVTYGYGTKTSMEEQGASCFADTPAELLKILL